MPKLKKPLESKCGFALFSQTGKLLVMKHVCIYLIMVILCTPAFGAGGQMQLRFSDGGAEQQTVEAPVQTDKNMQHDCHGVADTTPAERTHSCCDEPEQSAGHHAQCNNSCDSCDDNCGVSGAALLLQVSAPLSRVYTPASYIPQRLPLAPVHTDIIPPIA